MRRAGGQFEIPVKAPTMGLITRVPGEQLDPRAATVGVNVRFEDGVVKNGEGVGAFNLLTFLDSPAVLIFQGSLSSEVNGVPNEPVVIGSAQKLYALVRRTEMAASPVLFFPDVTGYTGGGPTKVDGIPTLGVTYRMVCVSFADDDLIYKIRAKTGGDTPDGVSIITPTDADPTVNNVIFVKVG